MKKFLSPVVIFLAIALIIAIAASQFMMRETSAPGTPAPVDSVVSGDATSTPLADKPLDQIEDADRLLLGALQQSGQHATLLKAIEAAGLQSILTNEEFVTIFAPIDSAFAALPPATLESLLKPENKEVLSRLLQRHVVKGRYTVEGFSARATTGKIILKSMAGSDIPLAQLENGPWYIETAYGERSGILRPDQTKVNGVVHSIDRVLSQTSPTPVAAPAPVAAPPAAAPVEMKTLENTSPAAEVAVPPTAAPATPSPAAPAPTTTPATTP